LEMAEADALSRGQDVREARLRMGGAGSRSGARSTRYPLAAISCATAGTAFAYWGGVRYSPRPRSFPWP
jgi:hypothetical protein